MGNKSRYSCFLTSTDLADANHEPPGNGAHVWHRLTSISACMHPLRCIQSQLAAGRLGWPLCSLALVTCIRVWSLPLTARRAWPVPVLQLPRCMCECSTSTETLCESSVSALATGRGIPQHNPHSMTKTYPTWRCSLDIPAIVHLDRHWGVYVCVCSHRIES